MVRRTARIAAALLLSCLLAGCVRVEAPSEIRAYASFYPIYALAARLGDGVPRLTVSCLAQPQDGCLRSYALSDWDAALLAEADVLLLGGRGLESFADVFSSGEIAAVYAMDNMALIDLGTSDGEEDPEGHFSGGSPWLFLSAAGARSIAAVLAAGMAELDPDYAHLYARNLTALDAELAEVQSAISEMAAGLPPVRACLLHEGLCYPAEDLGLEWALVPREAGSEYLENDLEELLGRVAETGCSLVCLERQAPQSLVEALEGAGYAVCRLDTFSTHTADGGASFCGTLLANAEALAAAAAAVGAGKP